MWVVLTFAKSVVKASKTWSYRFVPSHIVTYYRAARTVVDQRIIVVYIAILTADISIGDFFLR